VGEPGHACWARPLLQSRGSKDGSECCPYLLDSYPSSWMSPIRPLFPYCPVFPVFPVGPNNLTAINTSSQRCRSVTVLYQLTSIRSSHEQRFLPQQHGAEVPGCGVYL
jgi:hypothetical protein